MVSYPATAEGERRLAPFIHCFNPKRAAKHFNIMAADKDVLAAGHVAGKTVALPTSLLVRQPLFVGILHGLSRQHRGAVSQLVEVELMTGGAQLRAGKRSADGVFVWSLRTTFGAKHLAAAAMTHGTGHAFMGETV